MQSFSRGRGIAGLLLSAIATVAVPSGMVIPASAIQPYKVSGAGLRRRQKTSWPKGRAAKGRWAGTAGKLRP